MAVKVKSIKGDFGLKKIAKEIGGYQVKIGWLKNETYENGTRVAQNALTQEFGTDKIPARPFIRPAIKQSEIEINKKIKGIAKNILNKNYTVKQSMNVLGALIKKEIISAIVAVETPELSKYTIAKKGFSKPLEDTRLMKNSVTWLVEKTK